MKKFKLIAAAALVASLASCSKQDFIETKKEFQEGEEVAFTASKLAKSVAKTKVSHELNEEGTQLLNKWEANDAIKLYTEDYASAWGENDGLFQVVDPDAENVVFRGLATVGKPAKAVYPYDAKLILSDKAVEGEGIRVKGVELPTSQGGLGREATFLADYNPEGPVNFEFKPFHSIVVIEREAFLAKVGVIQDDFTSFTVKVIENNIGQSTKSYFVRPISEAKSAEYWYVAIDPVRFDNSVISIEFQNNKKLSVNVNPGTNGEPVAYNISPDAVVSAIPEGFVDLGVVNDKGKKVFWGESNILHSPVTPVGDGTMSSDLETGTFYMFGFPEKIYNAVAHLGGVLTGCVFALNNQYKDYGFDEHSYPAEYKSKYFNYTEGQQSITAVEVEPCDDIAYLKNNAWRTPSENDWESLQKQCFCVVDNSTKIIYVYKAKDNSHKGITAVAPSADDISGWRNLEYFNTIERTPAEGFLIPDAQKYTEANPRIVLYSGGYAESNVTKSSGSHYFMTRTSYNGLAPVVFGNVEGSGISNLLTKIPLFPISIGINNPYIGCCIRPVAYGN